MKEKNGYVYFASCSPGYLKVGFSINPIERVYMVGKQRGYPEDADIKSIQFVRCLRGQTLDELIWHADLSKFRAKGHLEWYRDSTEARAALSPFCIGADYFLRNREGAGVDPKSSRFIGIKELETRIHADRVTLRALLVTGRIPGIKIRIGKLRKWVVMESVVAKAQQPEYWA